MFPETLAALPEQEARLRKQDRYQIMGYRSYQIMGYPKSWAKLFDVSLSPFFNRHLISCHVILTQLRYSGRPAPQRR